VRHGSKFASFIRRGESGAIDPRLADLVVLERKFSVTPTNLVGSIADNALVEGLADLNQYLPEGVSANIKGVDFSDIKAELDAKITARIAEIGLPVDENDPVIKAAIQSAAAQIPARLQQDGMGLTEFIWRSRDDRRVRALHQDHEDQIFSWSTPPEYGAPGTAFGCRCSAEPVFVMEDLPEGATCERLTAEKLREVFPDASDERLRAFAEELDAMIDIG
jgi:Phage Mu protein F like protein